MNGMNEDGKKKFLSLLYNTSTEWHPMKLMGYRFRMNKREYFFTGQVIK